MKGENIILNTKTRDSGAKMIFDNPILCAQFLKDFVKGIPFMENISPEDIEDVSGQFVPLFSEERNSDSVKRVSIKDIEEPFFIISLIEHKTDVEYNVCMQIFRYMVYIWEAFEREMEGKHPGISHTKGFHYPPVLPIVYYEGQKKWNAPMNFAQRIARGSMFTDYIPDFRYYLVELNKYSNQELLERKDDISLVMMINKLQSMEDINAFRKIPTERVQEMVDGTPESVVRIIADILRTLLLKVNMPEDLTEDMVKKVREKKMAQLFENFEPIDIQEEWKKLDIARGEVKAEREKLDADKERVDAEREKVKAEGERVDAEREKVKAEGERVDAEREKVKAEREEAENGKKELEEKKKELEEEKKELKIHREEFDRERKELEKLRILLEAERHELEERRKQ